jgi:hypothetical protein
MKDPDAPQGNPVPMQKLSYVENKKVSNYIRYHISSGI